MIFAFEHIARNRPYPNLGRLAAQPGTAKWYKFSRTWPYSEPWQFWEYIIDEKIDGIHARRVQDLGHESAWYPIALSFFDHGIDYLGLIPESTRELMRTGQVRLLFYYSEGDNPSRIKSRLCDLSKSYAIDPELMIIATANSACDTIPGMIYVADDELLYRLRNKHPAESWNAQTRSKKFTALVRTHKSWRAWTMAWLWHQGVDQHSYFSYDADTQDPAADQGNPLNSAIIPDISNISSRFLAGAPYFADGLDSPTRNDYHLGHVSCHFTDSYLNLILETHMDVDQSNGVFLTEKTFKPIKHCQPFLIFGAAHSLKQLQSMGYRTFDHVIDPTYDSISDTTQRWLCLQQTISHLQQQDLHKIAQACREDCEHNQRLFLSSKRDRLNNLLGKLKHVNQ